MIYYYIPICCYYYINHVDDDSRYDHGKPRGKIFRELINVIDVLNDTEISVSFVTEGAGYRNTLGFFIYETKNQPKSISEIYTAHIIFANCSKVNSGGNLRSGDTMQLPFSYDENKFNYTFPSGYSVGFLLFSDAWNGVDVKRNIRPYSSLHLTRRSR